MSLHYYANRIQAVVYILQTLAGRLFS